MSGNLTAFTTSVAAYVADDAMVSDNALSPLLEGTVHRLNSFLSGNETLWGHLKSMTVMEDLAYGLFIGDACLVLIFALLTFITCHVCYKSSAQSKRKAEREAHRVAECGVCREGANLVACQPCHRYCRWYDHDRPRDVEAARHPADPDRHRHPADPDRHRPPPDPDRHRPPPDYTPPPYPDPRADWEVRGGVYYPINKHAPPGAEPACRT